MDVNKYVQEVSLEDFNKPFRHEAFWNHRLQTTGGRFFPKDGHLDFNPKLLEIYGLDIFRKIVRHELCHYHLYYEEKGYQHKDREFKQLLNEVGGLRFAPTLPSKKKQYICTKCNQIFSRKRKINIQKYCCGKCGGKLTYVETIKK